jgi:hypothetical protein
MVLLRPDLPFTDAPKDFSSPATPDYDKAEQLFVRLLTTENLDRRVSDRLTDLFPILPLQGEGLEDSTIVLPLPLLAGLIY